MQVIAVYLEIKNISIDIAVIKKVYGEWESLLGAAKFVSNQMNTLL